MYPATNQRFSASTGSLQSGKGSVHYTGIPSECPVCREKISPVRQAQVMSVDNSFADVCFQCPSHTCQHLFIGRYEQKGTGKAFQFLDAVPLTYSPPQIAGEVKEVSPSFSEIYRQSIQAESAGLDQMVGTGLRKAVEFLIRDFLIAHPPEKLSEEQIAEIPLTNLIEHHIDDARIRDMALRAWWLGSDDTHYVRRYEDHDIDDLKAVIRTLMNWVENYLLTMHYSGQIGKHGSVVAVETNGKDA